MESKTEHPIFRGFIGDHHPPGTPPGTLGIDPHAPKPVLTATAFGPDGVIEQTIQTIDELPELRKRFPILWLDVSGLGDAEVITGVGTLFGLHRLALEDVVHLHQRAKVEQYDQHFYIVVREPEPRTTGADGWRAEQISFFLGRDFVITFQETAGDSFDPVRNRLRRGGPIRSRGADYLAYALIDAAVDSWFPVLEDVGERIDTLEDKVLADQRKGLVAEIHQLRRELLAFRRAVWPLRDSLGMLYRDPSPLIKDETRIYLRDCYDHAVQIIDLVENYREMVGDLTDVYLTSVSNRMNEVMKVLTVISTIFLPLSFIAGVYGMNFDRGSSPLNMPELGWKFGYFFALFLMVATALGLLAYFWRRGWLRTDESRGLPEPSIRPDKQL